MVTLKKKIKKSSNHFISLLSIHLRERGTSIMPNVDKATRLLNSVVLDSYCHSNQTIKDNKIIEFVSLPNNEKPISYRNKTHQQIKIFFDALNPALKNLISESYGCDTRQIRILPDSNDNRIGADSIVHYVKQGKKMLQRLELKFGAKTDKNIGNAEMDKIFEIPGEEKKFRDMLLSVKQKQRTFVNNVKNADLEKISSNLEKLLIETSDFFKDLLIKKKLILNQTRLIQAMKATGAIDQSENMENMLIVRIDYAREVNRAIKVLPKPDLNGEWKITSIQKQKESNRIEVRTTNKKNDIKFLLNWKNNHVYNNIEYPSLMGLGTSSWNVWIYPNESQVNQK
jgi:hypothetical protein